MSTDIELHTPYFGQGLRGLCAVIFLPTISSEYMLAYTDNSSGLLTEDRGRQDDIVSSIIFGITFGITFGIIFGIIFSMIIRSRQVRQRPLSLADRGSQH